MKSKKDSTLVIKCSQCESTRVVTTHKRTGEYRCLNCGCYLYIDGEVRLRVLKEDKK